ncbi:MAG: hypothetical protein V3R80_07845 [Candidatus Tectomicrobia bacterium]
MMHSAFWTHLETLIQSSELVIDRPKGSRHPRDASVMYPLDYGYLQGTSGGDGQEVDVWRGSVPDGCFDAVVSRSYRRLYVMVNGSTMLSG